MSKTLAAKICAALLVSGSAFGAVIDETPNMPAGPGNPGMGGMMGGGSLGAGENRAMRTAVSLQAVQAAFDQSDPRANVERFAFDPNMTYKLRLREFMGTTVVLPVGEQIDGFNLGDSGNFTFTPYAKEQGKGKNNEPDRLSNIFSITPKYPGADTSLVIFGKSGRIYSFYLRADSVKSPHLPHLVVYITDTVSSLANGTAAAVPGQAAPAGPAAIPEVAAGGDPATGEESADMAEYLRSLPLVDPKSIHLNAYKIVDGDKALAPVRVFDDGYWTYFQLSKEGNLDKAKVPAIYRVVDGVDTPVNIRVEGGTVIAETMSKAWTIRAGEAHLCVRAR